MKKEKKDNVYKNIFHELDAISDQITFVAEDYTDEIDEETYELISNLADDVLDVAIAIGAKAKMFPLYEPTQNQER